MPRNKKLNESFKQGQGDFLPIEQSRIQSCISINDNKYFTILSQDGVNYTKLLILDDQNIPKPHQSVLEKGAIILSPKSKNQAGVKIHKNIKDSLFVKTTSKKNCTRLHCIKTEEIQCNETDTVYDKYIAHKELSHKEYERLINR